MKKLLITILVLSVWGCKKNASDEYYSVDSTAEAGQQVGDAMAAIDESGGNTNGSIAKIDKKAIERAFARFAPNEISTSQAFMSRLFPNAEATACNAVAFSACSSGSRVKSFSGCSTFAGGEMSGNVTLNFTGSGVGSCTIPANNDVVSRVPNFSITGLRGATFSVTATSSGQSLKRTGGSTYEFTNSGIRRSFTTPKGTTLLDITTTTGSAISVTGNSRASRTVSGGSLIVTNNLNSASCTLTPSSVSWSSGCNCPTAGSWSGSCTDGANFEVAFGSTCGEATVTKGSGSSTVVMDRCQ